MIFKENFHVSYAPQSCSLGLCRLTLRARGGALALQHERASLELLHARGVLALLLRARGHLRPHGGALLCRGQKHRYTRARGWGAGAGTLTALSASCALLSCCSVLACCASA